MKEKKRFSALQIFLAALGGVWAALLLVLLLLCCLLGRQGLSLLEAWTVAKVRYIGEYDPDAAADRALTGLVDGLGDRWSYYVNAQGLEAQNKRRDNTYVGVGVTVGYDDPRGLLILQVRAGTPAEAGGLLPGEVITAVDGKSAAGEDQSAAVEAIAGEEGAPVTLAVLSQAGEERTVTLTRALVENQSVRYELLENGVGYVVVENFYSHSGSQFTAAVDDLVERGATSLLFDVRDNGGGYVTELTEMLDHLLPEGPIFRSSRKSGRESVVTSDEAHIDLPMATLVNGNTYSAAEFFAAQLRESVSAPIVGEPTSGKGYFQQSVYLLNGGALNLSLGRYTTGAGVSLIGTGVTLDVELALDDEQAAALSAGTLSPADDPQVQAALSLLR